MSSSRPVALALALLVSTSAARAEYRTVLVRVKKGKDNTALVTVYSDEKKEQKSAITVEEAVKVISGMKGWCSAVGVYVASDRGVSRPDLKQLFTAVNDNVWLNLEYFGGEVPKVVGDHFLAGGERPAADDPFRAALVAAVHRFAAEGELDHLKAVLDKHPELIEAKQAFRQPHKPLRTDGFTPLHHAAERGREDVAAYLIERGTDVNTADGAGWTPLRLAAKQGHLAVVKRLVRGGAKVDAKTAAVPGRFGVPPSSGPGAKPEKLPAVPGLTPLELAQEAKRTDVVEYLKSAPK
jgi:hypothetical protein